MTAGVVLTGVHNVNNLGVLRGLGRKGIPITLLDVEPRSMVRYSRYVTQRVPCPDPAHSEEAFIHCLIELGRRMDHKPVMIPTGDAEVLVLSRHRETLDPFYRIPLSSPETVDLLVNKKRFFQELLRKAIPCPRTYFPESADEARDMAAGIGYPFIVKAAYSHEFIRRFQKKVFFVHSPSDFDTAARLLDEAQLDYFLQEIVPGDALFLFYSYFNRRALPLGVCGYDKVRQHPSDFGIGTVCRSINRPQPIDTAIRFLKGIDYHGLAEPEFKLDPRDGRYKLIEINTRSVTMTLLADACGVHMEYLAYLEMVEGMAAPAGPAVEDVLWIDEFNDLNYHLSRLRRGLFRVSETWKSFRGEKVFACAAWDDPVPFFRALVRFMSERLAGLVRN